MIKSPSFFSNTEEFAYLNRTSYYSELQAVVDKIIKFANPSEVLELGSALGTTLIKLAKKYERICFEGVDVSEDVVDVAKNMSKRLNNCSFTVEDMYETVKTPLIGFDLIFMLYSFHHIPDPIKNKEIFLKNCYKNMKCGAGLLIAETFLKENSCMPDIKKWYSSRADEGYASSFWNTLSSLTGNAIKEAQEVAFKSSLDETRAGEHVWARDEEFLVELEWLKKAVERAGFYVKIAEPVNSLGEAAVLFIR